MFDDFDETESESDLDACFRVANAISDLAESASEAERAILDVISALMWETFAEIGANMVVRLMAKLDAEKSNNQLERAVDIL